MEAQNLPKKIGLTEPYVRILYGPDITVRTKHVHKNSNPKWHKHFVLKGLYPKIIFEVFSFSILGRVRFLQSS